MNYLPRKTIRTLAAFAVFVVALRWLPGLGWFEPPGWSAVSSLPAVIDPPAGIKEPAAPPRPKAPPAPPDPSQLFIDPHQAMGPFYESLLRTEKKLDGAITRVLHYGDSPTTADSVTADTRALLQQRFGDAGHGFVLIARPWAWYGHRGVTIKASGWRQEPVSQLPRPRDSLYGLGGVSFTGGTGATSQIGLPGSHHRRLDVLYLNQPRGGTFHVTAGAATLVVDTAHTTASSGSASLALPEGVNEVRIQVTRGPVRMFGVTAENDGPGVVYHSLGLNGASIQHLLWYIDPAHWRAQIEFARPDLIVLNYGANESHFASYVNGPYATELRALLLRLREAAPKTSILMMSPMDRGERNSRGEIGTPPVLEKVVDIQRRVAVASGCAFFNTYLAMGGPGTMGRWYTAQPRLVSADFLHPLPAGAAKVGALFDRALYNDYVRWKAGEP